jgi:hypothetical protein
MRACRDLTLVHFGDALRDGEAEAGAGRSRRVEW